MKPPFCRRCGCSLYPAAGDGHVCGACLANQPLYGRARAGFIYEEPLTALLHGLKYRADFSTLPVLAELIRPLQEQLGVNREDDRVVPVPLHRSRLMNRGFNQSLLLAALFFSGAQSLILPQTLLRVRNTAPQTSLDGMARRKNLTGAFAVSDASLIRGRRVFLVDDVFTTGTTVNECSRTLLAAGAIDVEVLTVARVARLE
ncbi:MAG: ComF family protein [Desulfobulbaceae bacterium]|uniref:ComF family protein n=1 Tax=Candidatus Desulfatifera sulfidica TaxID=2841691 RepID=A0A8J6NBQ1_9BACT|nr:ComF family protein [Candidatus Desulfatifera sulfidica]